MKLMLQMRLKNEAFTRWTLEETACADTQRFEDYNILGESEKSSVQMEGASGTWCRGSGF